MVGPRNGCDGRLMAKNLITTIQVNMLSLLNTPLVSLFSYLLWLATKTIGKWTTMDTIYSCVEFK